MSELFSRIDLQGATAVAEVERACRSVGFFEVVGHGVDPMVIADLRGAAEAFFALPPDVKQACAPTGSDSNRGYIAKGAETSSYSVGLSAPPDLFEAFAIGGGRSPSATVLPDLRGLYAPDVWPEESSWFRSAMSAYFEAMVPLAYKILDVFAEALELDAGWFVERVDAAPDTLRVIQYESQPHGAELVEGQLGMGPHTDYGVLTILLADPVPGLQVLGPDGAWHDLIATEGAFIINIGDLVAQWTNDRWVSSVHRVLPPARLPDRPAIRRSIPFFKEANADTVIRCLESCCSEQRPARYEPMLAGDHLMAKLLGPRLKRTADTISTIGERAVGVGIPAS